MLILYPWKTGRSLCAFLKLCTSRLAKFGSPIPGPWPGIFYSSQQRIFYASKTSDQPLGAVRAPIEQDILDQAQQLARDLFVNSKLARVDDAHIQYRPNRLIKECRMRRLPERIIPFKGKGLLVNPDVNLQ